MRRPWVSDQYLEYDIWIYALRTMSMIGGGVTHERAFALAKSSGAADIVKALCATPR
ncbi:hypothetical protein MPC4_10358 [Methylocella tundrae]|uniref:Uncharacterized protein n=1 Tax=Methylocella tundrae TaxID=227605 RepID=A0A8B6M0R5_METTU|nr:hypothetical protein MPC4_10358 [Methylocella tundrae]